MQCLVRSVAALVPLIVMAVHGYRCKSLRPEGLEVVDQGKPYDHEAVTKCVEGLKELVREGVTHPELHLKLRIKLTSLSNYESKHPVMPRKFPGTSPFEWSDPPEYEPKGRILVNPRWVWNEEEELYVDKTTRYHLKPWEEYSQGSIIFVDPYDNEVNY